MKCFTTQEDFPQAYSLLYLFDIFTTTQIKMCSSFYVTVFYNNNVS